MMTGDVSKKSVNLTSYDLLKSLAVLLMLIDHTGFYFFEDDSWWRVLGRLCVPIWFFLIGYARSRDIGPQLWVGASILILSSFIVGIGALPVNILGTMLVIRIVIDPVMNCAGRSPQALWGISALLFLLILPSSYLFEYGTLAIIMAMFGWLVRHQNEYPEGKTRMQHFFVFSVTSFVVMQNMFFAFEGAQVVVLGLGAFLVLLLLMFFRPMAFEGTGLGIKGILTAPLRFMGRRTLEIYVAHLLVFMALGAYFKPERFTLFDWKLLPEGMLDFTISSVN